MPTIEVGLPYPRVAGKPEGVYFDIHSGSPELLYHVAEPNPHELAQISARRPFEICMSVIDDIIFATVKMGDMPWIGMPYNPRLSSCELPELWAGSDGYLLQLFVTDIQTNIIQYIRGIELGFDFSRGLREMVYTNKENGMSSDEYDRRLQTIYTKYTADDIMAARSLYFRTEGVILY